jgi:hypothetical protein
MLPGYCFWNLGNWRYKETDVETLKSFVSRKDDNIELVMGLMLKVTQAMLWFGQQIVKMDS